jgi:hypothetical protein
MSNPLKTRGKPLILLVDLLFRRWLCGSGFCLLHGFSSEQCRASWPFGTLVISGEKPI